MSLSHGFGADNYLLQNKYILKIENDASPCKECKQLNLFTIEKKLNYLQYLNQAEMHMHLYLEREWASGLVSADRGGSWDVGS